MPGDVLVGNPARPGSVATMSRPSDGCGMTLRTGFASSIHDIIPVRRPEWCDPAVVSAFLHWHGTTLPLADQVFTNSVATADATMSSRGRGKWG